MLVSAPSGTTIMSAPRRVNPTAMLLSMLRIKVGAGEHDPAGHGHGHDQQEAAGLAAFEIFRQRQAGESSLHKRAGARVLHVLQLGRDDHAVMMPAVARQDADQCVGGGIDDRDAARLSLEAAERRQHVLSVVGDGRRLAGRDRCPGSP